MEEEDAVAFVSRVGGAREEEEGRRKVKGGTREDIVVPAAAESGVSNAKEKVKGGTREDRICPRRPPRAAASATRKKFPMPSIKRPRRIRSGAAICAPLCFQGVAKDHAPLIDRRKGARRRRKGGVTRSWKGRVFRCVHGTRRFCDGYSCRFELHQQM